VVRTSWLYGANGKCFPKTISVKLLGGNSVSVTDDQLGSPTNTKDLAEFIYRLGNSSSNQKMFHGVSGGSTSWFGFARKIAAFLGVDPELVIATNTKNYQTPAIRPVNSVLEPSSIDGYQIPHWLEAWKSGASSVLGA
jgi:dTDP-4-dehydrorhamnose reductase